MVFVVSVLLLLLSLAREVECSFPFQVESNLSLIGLGIAVMNMPWSAELRGSGGWVNLKRSVSDELSLWSRASSKGLSWRSRLPTSGRGPAAGQREPPAKAGRTMGGPSLGSVCAHILLCVCTHHISAMCSVGSMDVMLCARPARAIQNPENRLKVLTHFPYEYFIRAYVRTG